jgi:hypothetical protein
MPTTRRQPGLADTEWSASGDCDKVRSKHKAPAVRINSRFGLREWISSSVSGHDRTQCQRYYQQETTSEHDGKGIRSLGDYFLDTLVGF